MRKRDFTIRQSNDSGRKTIRIINNMDAYDDDGIPLWKPKSKRGKRNKNKKLDPNNLIEAEIIKIRRKKLLDSIKALNRR